jgi:hypothetical protein
MGQEMSTARSAAADRDAEQSKSIDGDKADAVLSQGKRRQARRDAPLKCAHCHRTVRRKSRHQRFCSRRCRVSAFRAKTTVHAPEKVPPYPPTGSRNAQDKKASNPNGLKRKISGSIPHILGPVHVIEAEVVAERDWRKVTSADGVDSFVAHLRKRTWVSQ